MHFMPITRQPVKTGTMVGTPGFTAKGSMRDIMILKRGEYYYNNRTHHRVNFYSTRVVVWTEVPPHDQLEEVTWDTTVISLEKSIER